MSRRISHEGAQCGWADRSSAGGSKTIPEAAARLRCAWREPQTGYRQRKTLDAAQLTVGAYSMTLADGDISVDPTGSYQSPVPSEYNVGPRLYIRRWPLGLGGDD